MLAYMAPNQGEDEFIRQALVSGPNSFKRQNQLAFYEPGDPNRLAEPDFIADNRFDPDYIRWLKAGWGLAAFSADDANSGDNKPFTPHLLLRKSGKATFEDPEKYADTVEQVAHSHAPLVMGHLRESKLPGRETETHPFRIGPWIFMHQGDLSNQITRELREKLAQIQNAPQPVGQGDSELLGCYLAHRLAEQYGEPSKISTEQLIQEVGKLVQELRQWPKNPTETDQQANQKRGQGAEHPGMLNFMLSDGKRIIASASTYNPESYLQLGTRRMKNGETEYLLSTFKMQPASDRQKDAIHWQQVPNQSVVALERQSDRHGKPFVSCRQIALDDLEQLETSASTKNKPEATKNRAPQKPKPTTRNHGKQPTENLPKKPTKPTWFRQFIWQPIQRFGHSAANAWRWLLIRLGFSNLKRSKQD